MKFTLMILVFAGFMAWLTGCTPAYHAESLSPAQAIVKDARIERLKQECETCQRHNKRCLIGDDIDCSDAFGGKK